MFSAYMANTWILASIVALTAGFVGFFVVLRGASFAAHALPLCTFPGAAAAGLAGLAPIWGLIAFAALGVAGINRLARRQRNEVATALTLIALLGLGALCLSLSGQYAPSVYALLFGEVLGVSSAEIAPAALIGLGVAAILLLAFRPLLLNATAPELAAASGIPAQPIDLLFLATLGLATAAALPVVGALLIFSLMVGPAALARALTPRPLAALGLSGALALAMVWAAIAASYITNWPVGFFVGSLAALAYISSKTELLFLKKSSKKTSLLKPASRRTPRTSRPAPPLHSGA